MGGCAGRVPELPSAADLHRAGRLHSPYRSRRGPGIPDWRQVPMTRARWVDPDAQFVLDEAQPMTDQALEVLSEAPPAAPRRPRPARRFFLALGVLDRKSTRLNSSH